MDVLLTTPSPIGRFNARSPHGIAQGFMSHEALNPAEKPCREHGMSATVATISGKSDMGAKAPRKRCRKQTGNL
jgi:hypothetical protein